MFNTEKKSASTVAEQRAIILDCLEKTFWQKFCRFKNIFNLCSANHINKCFYAKILLNNKLAAYGCKFRDLSIFIDVVCSDRLSFINQKNF